MKKLFSIFVFTLSTMLLTAQLSKTINVQTAGALATLINSDEKIIITDLTITGNIDARDFKFMRDDLLNLGVLDLSGSTIQFYTGSDGTIATSNNYIENEIPASAFINKKTLNSVVLPNNLISISNNAFESCSGLTGNFIDRKSVV